MQWCIWSKDLQIVAGGSQRELKKNWKFIDIKRKVIEDLIDRSILIFIINY
jgi:hypothetical protein